MEQKRVPTVWKTVTFEWVLIIIIFTTPYTIIKISIHILKIGPDKFDYHPGRPIRICAKQPGASLYQTLTLLIAYTVHSAAHRYVDHAKAQ